MRLFNRGYSQVVKPATTQVDQSYSEQLIIVYPFITFTDAPTIRKFVSSYFLKEIVALDIIRSINAAFEAPKFFEHYSVQERIREKVHVLKELLLTDPQLRKFFPTIAIITTPSLVNIPVVTGTYQMISPLIGLTDFLLTAAILRQPLYTPQDIKKVYNYARTYNVPTLVRAILPVRTKLYQQTKQENTEVTLSLQRIYQISAEQIPTLAKAGAPSHIEKVYNAFLVATDKSKFFNELGFRPNPKLNLSLVRVDFERNIKHAFSMLSSYCIQVWGSTVQYITSIVGPYFYHFPASEAIDKIIEHIQQTNTENLYSIFVSLISNANSGDLANVLDKICEQLSKIDLSTIRFQSTSFEEHVKAYHEVLGNTKTIRQHLLTLFYQLDQVAKLTGPSSFTQQALSFAETVSTTIVSEIASNVMPRQQYATVAGGRYTIDATKFMNSMLQYLESAIQVVTLYTIARMLCVDLSSTRKQIDVSAAGAFKFPNYTVFLPFDLVKLLAHFILATDPSVDKGIDHDSFNELVSKSLPTTNPDKMFNLVYSTLFAIGNTGYANLIAVDTSSKTIYYRFMNMSKHVRTSLNQIQTFIKNFEQDTIHN